MLREIAVLKAERAPVLIAVHECVQEYREYLMHQRGLSVASLPNYLLFVEQFLSEKFAGTDVSFSIVMQIYGGDVNASSIGGQLLQMRHHHRDRHAPVHARAVHLIPEGTRLLDAAKMELEFHFHHIEGTFVCFWSPKYSSSFSVPGYHFHFISEDRRRGGMCSTAGRSNFEPAFKFCPNTTFACRKQARS
jgi:hypothetical protein